MKAKILLPHNQFTAMQFFTAIFCGLLFIAFPGPNPDTPATSRIEFSIINGSKVSIHGETNVKNFNCFSSELFSGMQATFYKDNAADSVIYFKDASLDIDIKSLDCGNSGMNKDMLHALKSSEYPVICIRLNNVRPVCNSSLSATDWTEYQLYANITLAGVTQPAKIIFKGKKIGNNQFRFIGEYSLKMTRFGITPPTALFGVIKVKDAILVQFDLLIQAQFVH